MEGGSSIVTAHLIGFFNCTGVKESTRSSMIRTALPSAATVERSTCVSSSIWDRFGMRNAGMKSLPCFTNGGFDSSFYILPSRQTMIILEEQGFSTA